MQSYHCILPYCQHSLQGSYTTSSLAWCVKYIASSKYKYFSYLSSTLLNQSSTSSRHQEVRVPVLRVLGEALDGAVGVELARVKRAATSRPESDMDDMVVCTTGEWASSRERDLGSTLKAKEQTWRVLRGAVCALDSTQPQISFPSRLCRSSALSGDSCSAQSFTATSLQVS